MKRYRIISELGKGATGIVFRAVSSKDGSTVALKKLVLPGHLDAREEEEFIKRFKTEGKAALSLKHPGIVSAIDSGLDEGTFYIAYELIDGVTIEEALKSGREFPPDEVTDLIVQASSALEYAHSQGVVHRDISPGNIYVGKDGKIRISDFGVAGFTSRVTMTAGSDAIVGTPGYMSPEQITGGDADPRSDIFSLGCVAYELLTGKQAFSGDNLATIVHNVINKQPVPIREINPKVPPALEELVFRMLAKKIEYRFQGMSEVNASAINVLEQIPVQRKKSAVGETTHTPMLVISGGSSDGKQYILQPTVTTIGKTIGDILIDNDPGIAGQHAWITRTDTGWVLYDADTESGTFLNGERIEQEEILPGDKIQIGETILEFRGAGGHVGQFAESVTKAPADQDKQAGSPISKTAWPVVVILAIPGILVIAALIVFGIILPAGYHDNLDAVTVTRWVSAYTRLDIQDVGTPDWNSDVINILAEWEADPLVSYDSLEASGTEHGPADYMMPAYIPGHEKFNNEVDFRFRLFQLTEQFLNEIALGTAGMNPDNTRVSPVVQAVSGLRVIINQLETGDGISPIWAQRKNQLLAVVNKWITNATGSSEITVPVTFHAEIEQAQESILTGYYTYQGAGTDINILNDAIIEFQNAIQDLSNILSISENEDARALRALTYFLGARIYKEAADIQEPRLYNDALVYLDNADADLAYVGPAAWDHSIPLDFTADFPTHTSLQTQINALKAIINQIIANMQSNG